LYVLDEPTTGLHFQDIELLTHALFGLRDAGNSIVLIEHNIDLVCCADWVVDMGPEGGENGGRIVATGSPEEVASVADSYTGRYLKQALESEPSRATKSETREKRSATRRATTRAR
jgi:excinuclease ABC subunit A